MRWPSVGAHVLLGLALPLLYINLIVHYLHDAPGHKTDERMAYEAGRRWARDRASSCGRCELDASLWHSQLRTLQTNRRQHRRRMLAWTVPVAAVLLLAAIALLMWADDDEALPVAISLAFNGFIFIVVAGFELLYTDRLHEARYGGLFAPATKAA